MQHDDLRDRIAQGWTAMGLCFLATFLMGLVKSAIRNEQPRAPPLAG